MLNVVGAPSSLKSLCDAIQNFTAVFIKLCVCVWKGYELFIFRTISPAAISILSTQKMPRKFISFVNELLVAQQK